MKRLISFLSVFLILAASLPVYAQFEGEVVFQLREFRGGGSQTTQFKITSSYDRIYIDSAADVNVITGLQSDGLLVRNDLQDFVINTGTNEALKVTKADLDGLMNMIERFSEAPKQSSTDQINWQNRIVETENSKQHLGYTVNEIRLLGDTVDDYVSVWLTEEMKVQWGIMTNVWNRVGDRFFDPDFPIELVMNSNSFPLLIDVYDNGLLTARVESISVDTENFDRSVLELSDQKRLVSLSEVMMNMFR